MKHSSPINATDVDAALREAGIAVTTPQAERLADHANAVLAANRLLNLTRITASPDVIRLHIVDSLLPTQLAAPIAGPIVDIGSGAGYPGIPLSVFLDQQTTLCESVGKKAAFLRQYVEESLVQAVVYAGRAEDLARTESGRYATVVARAVSALPSLVELAAPLLRPGGRLLAMKGILSPEELDRGDRAAVLCGLERAATHEYVLPAGGEARSLVLYQKVSSPALSLPRRVGLAQTKPLG